jgi:hypothetical protein
VLKSLQARYREPSRTRTQALRTVRFLARMLLESSMMPTPWHTITSTTAADAFLQLEVLRVWSAFLQPTTITGAARSLNIPASTLKYQLDKLVHWGVIEMSTKEGKIYSASKNIFIPFASTSAESLAALLRYIHERSSAALSEDLARAWLHHAPALSNGGFCLQADDDGRWNLEYSLDPPPDLHFLQAEMVDTWDSWTTLHLEHHHAQQLRQELRAVWQRWLEVGKHPRANAVGYTLRLGLVRQRR